MSFQSTNSPCPCESGREFSVCCGNDINTDLNFVFDLAADTNLQPLSNELKLAVDNINKEPGLFPIEIDFINDDVELVKMSPYWYSESTFLDRDRVQGRCAIKADINWLQSHVDKTQWQPLPFIFHSAFCGSTLMVNALELFFNTLPLREPDVLGKLLNCHLSDDVTAAQEQEYQYLVMSLLSRRFDPAQVPIYKGNDLQNAYVSTLLDWPAEFPLLFMYTGLNDFIAGCIKVDIRIDWITDRYEYCHRYFELRFNLDENESSLLYNAAEKAAAYWAFNMLFFIECIEKSPARVRTLNFADMLKDPLSSIRACGEWFQLEKLEGVNQQHELNWLLGHHSKYTSHAYSPAQREDEIKSVLKANIELLTGAEAVARKILGDKFPEQGLPNKL